MQIDFSILDLNKMMKKLFLNDHFILVLIVINAITIFISGFELGAERSAVANTIDNVITLLFLLEVIIKIKAFGVSYFSSNWNRFDFVLILLSLPALFLYPFEAELRELSFPLILRVMRVFKSFRLLKLIPGIDQLLGGIIRALKSSIIVIIGFVVYLFIIGVFSFYLFNDCGTAYFTNPLISLYSIFKIFTIEGWFEIPEALCENLTDTQSFFTYLYFIFVVLTGGMLGLSLVNSIFVDAMVSDNNDALEKKIDRLEAKIDSLLSQKKE